MTRSMTIKWLKWIQNMFPKSSEQSEALSSATLYLEGNCILPNYVNLLSEIICLEKDLGNLHPITNREQEIIWSCQARINNIIEKYKESEQ